ncbi:MAG TPA: CHAD domain-containing protein [Sphingomonas sp.]|uniref:CYTH and CHAD domain-containing protein n=1 Tax=Sphingomonas sp. TaxID=28214 RepID=UPI002CF06232|nr:CHAD domain-containing protein [Sphingomonas sp.]HMI18071.1 CHAD domain-containing protein [Sphingomonas sp.]
MVPPDEIELKFELEPEDLVRLEHCARLQSEDATSDRLVSRYFDTGDHDLRRAGYTLRVRRAKGGAIQTVKQESRHAAGLFARAEWERPITGKFPVIERGDGPVPDLVDKRDLELAFTTDVTRSLRNVALGGARIEVALDDGRIKAGLARQKICELELELKGGGHEPLFTLARELNALVPLRLGVRSKAERGYALAKGKDRQAFKAEPIRLDPDGDVHPGFAAIATACIRHFRLNEPLLLETGAAEPLHQARVALRRLRSAFSSFKPLLARDPQTDPLRDNLRWLAGVLGQVRDLDILIPKMRDADRDRLIQARAAAIIKAEAALESLRTRGLMIDLAEWIAIGAWRTRPAKSAPAASIVTVFAAHVLDRHRKRLRRRGQHLARLSDHDRHKVRIEAKKLRYAAEFFASLWPTGKARRRQDDFLEAMEKLQDQLGELNDRVTAPDLLARFGIEHRPHHRDGRRALLRRAESAFDELMDVKPFWR